MGGGMCTSQGEAFLINLWAFSYILGHRLDAIDLAHGTAVRTLATIINNLKLVSHCLKDALIRLGNDQVERVGVQRALDCLLCTRPLQIIAPYAHWDIPAIGQAYVLFRAHLQAPFAFGPGQESLETALFDPKDIPYEDLAFSSVALALRFYLQVRMLVYACCFAPCSCLTLAPTGQTLNQLPCRCWVSQQIACCNRGPFYWVDAQTNTTLAQHQPATNMSAPCLYQPMHAGS